MGESESLEFSKVVRGRCAARELGERESVKFSGLLGEGVVPRGELGERERAKFNWVAGRRCAARGLGEKEGVKFSEPAWRELCRTDVGEREFSS